jgi:Tfp pilus assembly protein PilN
VSQQVNLYRPIFRKQEKKFSALAMFQAGMLMLLGVVVLYMVLLWQVNSTRKELARTEKQHAEVSARLQDVTQKFGPKTPTQTLVDRVAKLEQDIAVRQRIHVALKRDLFTNTRGYSDYFLAFARQHVAGVWLTGFSITGAGEDMKLQGRTNDPVQVPRYVQRLSAERSLAGKEFQLFVLKRDKGQYSDFTFQAVPTKDGRN